MPAPVRTSQAPRGRPMTFPAVASTRSPAGKGPSSGRWRVAWPDRPRSQPGRRNGVRTTKAISLSAPTSKAARLRPKLWRNRRRPYRRVIEPRPSPLPPSGNAPHPARPACSRGRETQERRDDRRIGRVAMRVGSPGSCHPGGPMAEQRAGFGPAASSGSAPAAPRRSSRRTTEVMPRLRRPRRSGRRPGGSR